MERVATDEGLKSRREVQVYAYTHTHTRAHTWVHSAD